MLSAADFPDVFPWMAERLPGHERDTRSDLPGASCLARWEDDGGRTLEHASGSRAPTEGREISGHLVPWFVPFATFPAPAVAVTVIAILNASWTAPPR